MHRCTRVAILIVCYSMMTSFAIQSGKYVRMTDSSGAKICSTDLPSQVLPMYPGLEMRCGVRCMVSSCPYYQFKSSTPIQCELYNQVPVNFNKIPSCIGYRQPPSLSLPAACSFPFTYNGTLYNGCAPFEFFGFGCLSANRTTIVGCNSNAVVGVTNGTLNTGGPSIPIQSIFGWIIWLKNFASVTYNWNLTWSAYKNGFGSVGDSNYWLGLENVYQLTSAAKYRLRIEVQDKSSVWRSVEYWSVKVGDEATTKYTLDVDGFSGDAENGLQFVNQPNCKFDTFSDGMKFTTSDADNDRWLSGNCAASRGSGWWYFTCSRQCLTGSGSSFQWLGNGICMGYTLNEARMMLKLQ